MRPLSARRFTISVLLLLSSSISSAAEDLVMPFSCDASGADLKIARSQDVTYKILGARDEQPFVNCPAARSGACETQTVHRFALSCGGSRVSWSRIVDAAKAVGILKPEGLPQGYAPVSILSGRFVLPSLMRDSAAVTKVASQDLSPDSVREAMPQMADAGSSSWVTTVSASLSPSAENGALRVASAVVCILGLLALACIAAARSWHLAILESAKVWRGLARSYFRSAPELGAENAHGEAVAVLQARLLDAELQVASLPQDLLLRDILSGELEQIRDRASDAVQHASGFAAEKVLGQVRGLLRDVARIQRIAQSAQQEASGHSRGSEVHIPRSAAEAYDVLGLNADVAPTVAKKLIDALRQSWHPDFARDEVDRQRRENRMKQINAAWDIIKDQRAAA